MSLQGKKESQKVYSNLFANSLKKMVKIDVRTYENKINWNYGTKQLFWNAFRIPIVTYLVTSNHIFFSLLGAKHHFIKKILTVPYL